MDPASFPWFTSYSQPNEQLRGPLRAAMAQQSQLDQREPVTCSSFFSQIPIGPGFPFHELDYHLNEETASQRQIPPRENPTEVNPTIVDAGEPQKHMFEVKPFAHYPTRGFADAEFSLFNNSMFQYPVPNMDISYFPATKEEFNLHHYVPFQNYVDPPPNLTAQSTSISRQIEKSCNSTQNCQVCHSTLANGLHFGARTCAACAAFFRRTISDGKKYVCKRSQRCKNPTKDATGYRKICRSCRLKRCMDIGMLPDNVQHKRCRRDSPPPTLPKVFNTVLQPLRSHIPSSIVPSISSGI